MPCQEGPARRRCRLGILINASSASSCRARSSPVIGSRHAATIGLHLFLRVAIAHACQFPSLSTYMCAAQLCRGSEGGRRH